MPATRSLPIVGGDSSAMRGWAEQLVARTRAEGVELTGDAGLLTAMVRPAGRRSVVILAIGPGARAGEQPVQMG